MRTIGLVTDPDAKEIPASHLDLAECPSRGRPVDGHARRLSADLGSVV